MQSPQHEARATAAICAAVTRPTRRVGPITRVEPQDLQALQRLRERLITARTALVHAIRGLLHAYGLVRPHSLAQWRAWIVDRLEADQANLTALRTEVVWQLDDECLAVENRLAHADEQLAALGRPLPQVNGGRPSQGAVR